MASAKTAQVLIKLLEKVPDSQKLSTLLEPANLLILLHHYGHNIDDLRTRLQTGTLPGELLLELLEQEPNADRLLERLGPSATQPKPAGNTAKPAETPAPTAATPATNPARPVASPVQSAEKITPAPAANPVKTVTVTEKARGSTSFSNSFIVALVIITLTTIVPALMITGFFGEIALSRDTATIIALVGGAVAGAIADSKQRLRGVLVGITFGVATLWSGILYFQARGSIIKIEMVIPLLGGLIPAAAVYYVLSRLFPKR